MRANVSHASKLDLSLGLLLIVLISFFGLFSENKNFLLSGNRESCGIYCVMAKDYLTMLGEQSFDQYYFSKSLGSMIAHFAMVLLGLQQEATLTNLTLEVMSYVFAFGICWVWWLICIEIGYNRKFFWVGFLSLFFNQLFFWELSLQQETPDILALFVGISFAYAFLRKSLPLKYFFFSVGQFVQPQLALFMVPMIMFPRGRLTAEKPSRLTIDRPLKFLRKLLIALKKNKKLWQTLIVIFYIVLFSLTAYILPLWRDPYHGVENSFFHLFPVAIFLSVLLMSSALIKLLPLDAILILLKHVGTTRTLKIALIISLIYLVKSFLVVNYGQGPVSAVNDFRGAVWIIYSWNYQTIEQPIKSIFAHIIYFGPIILVIISAWSGIISCAKRLEFGAGFTLSLMFLILLIPNSESRHLVAFLPYLIIGSFFKIKGLGKFQLTAFVILAALSTRLLADKTNIPNFNENWIITWGPWWSDGTYYKAVFVAFLSFGLLYIGRFIDSKGQQD